MFCKQYKMVFGKKCWFRGGSKIWNFRKLNITRLTSHKMVLSKNIWSLGTLNYQNRGADSGSCDMLYGGSRDYSSEFWIFRGRKGHGGGEHEHRNIQYMLPTRSHGFWIQSIGETTLEELFFVSNRTYVLSRYHFPAHHGPSPWYSLFYHLIKYSRTVLSTVFW